MKIESGKSLFLKLIQFVNWIVYSIFNEFSQIISKKKKKNYQHENHCELKTFIIL